MPDPHVLYVVTAVVVVGLVGWVISVLLRPTTGSGLPETNSPAPPVGATGRAPSPAPPPAEP